MTHNTNTSITSSDCVPQGVTGFGQKRILIAVDKFKGSLTSLQAAQAIKSGFEMTSSSEQQEFRIIEIADGGDGSLDVLRKRLPDSSLCDVSVHNPVGDIVASHFLLYTLPDTCAFIEMAKVSGLEMLAAEQRNPLYTSTYGMGEAIKAAVSMGARHITLSIGGSATNDGGAGMLQALGYVFLDGDGNEIAAPICGGDLVNVKSIRPSCDLGDVEFEVICDVTNPLLGTEGATAVYGPQKGADAEALKHLEQGLANYASVAERCLGVDAKYKNAPGAGAAGGVGYAGVALLGARLIPGWKFFAKVTSLEESIQWADLVITGEGSVDSQSLSGKVVNGVLELSGHYNKQVMIFCGVSKLSPAQLGPTKCYSIASLGYPLEICMRDAAKLLQQLAHSAHQIAVLE